jgi:hypothetical protein
MTQAPRLTGVRALGALMDLGYAPIHDFAGPIADAIADEAGGIIWVATQRSSCLRGADECGESSLAASPRLLPEGQSTPWGRCRSG